MEKAKKIKAVKRRKTGKDGKVKALWITGGVLAGICCNLCVFHESLFREYEN